MERLDGDPGGMVRFRLVDGPVDAPYALTDRLGGLDNFGTDGKALRREGGDETTVDAHRLLGPASLVEQAHVAEVGRFVRRVRTKRPLEPLLRQ